MKMEDLRPAMMKVRDFLVIVIVDHSKAMPHVALLERIGNQSRITNHLLTRLSIGVHHRFSQITAILLKDEVLAVVNPN